MAEAPASHHLTPVEDSRRWRNIVRRPGDIVLCAPSRAGSTALQTVVAALLWPDSEPPEDPGDLSPWIDATELPIVELAGRVERQTHRRFFNTRSPGDCIPFDTACRYLIFWSPRERGESSVRLVASWWPRRHDASVMFVHQSDLGSDLEHEVRQIASFLGIELAESLWPAVIARCETVTTGAVSEHTDRAGLEDLDMLPSDAAQWLAYGSARTGMRPAALGTADTTVLDTGAWHPVYGRIGRQRPTNSIDAIAERRVAEARDAGLFDDLALHGKPLPDLAQQRQPGWWANQFVAKERDKVTALQIEAELRSAMPALWRLATPDLVAARVRELNERIARYNRATTLDPLQPLDQDGVLATWHRFQSAG